MLQSGPIFRLLEGIVTGDVNLIVRYASLIIVILLFAFPLHELAHAVVADKLGDNTPRQNGRISLNPLVHLSWVGSLLFLVLGFGWATTPINPQNFRGNWRMKHAAVALAGPVANLLLAAVFALVYRAGFAYATTSGIGEIGEALLGGVDLAVFVNLFLAFLNLIPIPPFDGGTILKAFASEGVASFLDQVGQYSWILFIVLANTGLFTLLVLPAVRSVYAILMP